MITLTECPVCGYGPSVPNANVLSPLKMDYFGHPAGVVVRYDRCTTCGTVFQNPRMSDEDLMRWYTSGEYRRITGSVETVDADELERAQRIASYGFRPNRHLDIGSSRGFLLREIGAAQQVGVEWNADWNRNPDAAILKEIPGEGKYDLITLIHSLEHVTNPRDVLGRLGGLLAEDGVIWIEVPSLESKGGPYRLSHTFFFELSSLMFMAGLAGLSLLNYKYTPHLFAAFEKKKLTGENNDNLS